MTIERIIIFLILIENRVSYKFWKGKDLMKLFEHCRDSEHPGKVLSDFETEKLNEYLWTYNKGE